MSSGFPPIPVYPLDYDSDFTLYLVFNTTETMLVANNQANSDEIAIKPQPANKPEIWANNGFATISGELLYYDAVQVNGDNRVCKLKRCVRGIGGNASHFNAKGSVIRGFVIAEHHNQLVQCILQAEQFIGENFSPNPITLDWRIRHLNDSPIISDGCPDAQFTFEIIESNVATGTLARYGLTIIGGSTTFDLQFGDGFSTNAQLSGTHLYAPGANIDPVLVLTSGNCQVVQTPITRTVPTEPKVTPPPPPFQVPIPIPPQPPDVNIPPIVLSPPDINIPPIQFPTVSSPGVPRIPSVIIVSPPINIPSVIHVTPINIPSQINITPIPPIPPIQFMQPNIPPIPIIPPNIPPIAISAIQVEGMQIPSIVTVEGISVIRVESITIPSVVTIEGISVIQIEGISIIQIEGLTSVIHVEGMPSTIQVEGLPSALKFEAIPPLSLDLDPITKVIDHIGKGFEIMAAKMVETINVKIPKFHEENLQTLSPQALENVITKGIHKGLFDYAVSDGSGKSKPHHKKGKFEGATKSQTLSPQVLENIIAKSVHNGLFDYAASDGARKPKPKHDGQVPDIHEEKHRKGKLEGVTKSQTLGPQALENVITKGIHKGLFDYAVSDGSGKSKLKLDIPESTSLELEYNLPETIRLASDNIPTSVPIQFPDEMPSLKIDVPDFLKISGIPDFLPVRWEGPDSIKVMVPDNTRIPLFYDGPPIPVQINLTIQNLADEAANGVQCVAIVPCPKK